jgi:hypothetical protein
VSTQQYARDHGGQKHDGGVAARSTGIGSHGDPSRSGT